METPSLLLIDDEVQYSELTKEYLEMKGCKVMLKKYKWQVRAGVQHLALLHEVVGIGPRKAGALQ